MFCTKCGTANSDTAIYCKKCGEQLETDDEDGTLVRPKDDNALVSAKNETQSEAKIFSIGPTLIFVGLGYAMAVLGAILLVAILTIVGGSFGLPGWLAVLLGLLLLLIPAYYHIKQKLVRYTLTDSTVEIDEGLISRTTRSVPLRRIQDVTVTATIMQRLLGFGDVVIDNASEDGGKVALKNINSPRKYADILLKQMRQLER